MSNYDSHYHPNSQVSEAEMDGLYTVLDDEQAAIIAHIKLVGKRNSHQMPDNQHPAEIAAALDAAKASLTLNRAKQFHHKYMMEESFQSWETWASDNGLEYAPYYQMCKIANRIAAGVLAGQIVNHL